MQSDHAFNLPMEAAPEAEELDEKQITEMGKALLDAEAKEPVSKANPVDFFKDIMPLKLNIDCICFDANQNLMITTPSNFTLFLNPTTNNLSEIVWKDKRIVYGNAIVLGDKLLCRYEAIIYLSQQAPSSDLPRFEKLDKQSSSRFHAPAKLNESRFVDIVTDAGLRGLSSTFYPL